MRIIFSFLALVFLFTSCDDGDVFSASLEFDDTFDTCGELVCYKIKTNPAETLSIKLNTTIEELIETETDPNNPLLVVLADDTNLTPAITSAFNYRTYSSEVNGDIFCNSIPPSDLAITNDYVSNGGEAVFDVVLTEDDNDGIPAALEDLNADGDNKPETNPTDTDGDGLPDYLDVDDDGDNVLTSVEIEGQTITTAIELALVRDTDGDGVLNYLDTDDDNDGVLTINEESFDDEPDLNPANDITSPNGIPDYLNDEVTDNDIVTTAYRVHTIQQSFLIQLTVIDITLDILTQDFVDFGTLTETSEREITPALQDNAYTVNVTQISGPNPATVAGDELNYKITLVNTGINTLTGISPINILPDGTTGTLSFVLETLTNDGIFEVGETWTYLISYVVTAEDIAAGTDLVNTISVTTTELPDPIEDTAETPIN